MSFKTLQGKMTGMISYRVGTHGISVEHLGGFFEGWPVAPSAEVHLAALLGSYRVVSAWDGGRLIGRVNVISDGVSAAFIPWLEVLPEYRGAGVGTELMRLVIAECHALYSLDLVCDPDVAAYYRTLGFQDLVGMGRRNSLMLE